MPIVLLNYTHPLTSDQLAQVAALLGEPPDQRRIAVQVDRARPLAEVAAELADAAALGPAEWQTSALLINPPALAPVALLRTALVWRGEVMADRVSRAPEAITLGASAASTFVVPDLELPPEKVNPNGSGISLGHPIGATGAIITTKALYELQRVGGRYALVTMCIGGGQGIAAIFERA